MILKYQLNMKLDNSQNISVSTEAVVDDESEAEASGEQFAHMMSAFIRGYGQGINEEFPGDK